MLVKGSSTYNRFIVTGISLFAFLASLTVVGCTSPTSLTGVPRIQAPLFSYENEAVYDEVQSLVSDQNAFVADFYRQLAKEEEGNLFYSPQSLYTAMAVVYAGAESNTATQFQDVMNIGAASDKFHGNLNSLDLTLLNDSLRPGQAGSDDPYAPPTLSVANGLWIQDGLEVRPDFLNTVTANYGIGLQQLDFRESPDGAVEAINQWVKQETQDKIEGVINRDSITDDTSLVVTNAIYFKGDWDEPFEKDFTSDQPFYLLDGQVVQVPMMFQPNSYSRFVGEGYQAVELPYRGNDFDLLVVMPDEGTFEAFEQSLSGDRLQTITEYMSGGPVILELPRFKLEYSFSAKEGLQGLGLSDAFDRDRADFEPIASSLFGLPIEELWIEDAVQKAFIEVNEKGSQAAAATAFFGGSMAASIPPPPVEITIDRPFIFLLRHSDTGAVLFMGRVLNPDPSAPVMTRSEIPPTPTPGPPEFTESRPGRPELTAVPNDILVREGKQIFLTGAGQGATTPCVACHTVEGLDEAVGLLGPDLSHIGTEAAHRQSGLSARDYLEQSIRERLEGVERPFAWPSARPSPIHTSGHTDEDVEALVAFLLTLK